MTNISHSVKVKPTFEGEIEMETEAKKISKIELQIEEIEEQERSLKRKKETLILEKSLYQRKLENILAEALRKTEIKLTLERPKVRENHYAKALLHQFIQKGIDSAYITSTSNMRKQIEVMSYEDLIYHLLEIYLCYDFDQLYHMKYNTGATYLVPATLSFNRLELDKLDQICELGLDTVLHPDQFIKIALEQSNVFQAYHQLSPENQNVLLTYLLEYFDLLVSVAIKYPEREYRMMTPNCKYDLKTQFETYYKKHQSHNIQLQTNYLGAFQNQTLKKNDNPYDHQTISISYCTSQEEIQLATNKGSRHRHGQDDASVFVEHSLNKNYKLFAVCDGVSSSKNSQQGSKFVTERLSSAFQQIPVSYFEEIDQMPKHNMEESSLINEIALIVAQIEADVSRQRLGQTTLSFAVVTKKHTLIYQVGDSSIYIAKNGVAKKMTTEQTLTYELFKKNGQTLEGIEAEEIRKFDPYAHTITNAIGTDQNYLLKPEQIISNHDYDYMMLCSDGVTNPIPTLQLYQILSQCPKADQLVDTASYGDGDHYVKERIIHAGSDNATAITYKKTFRK